MFIFFRCISWCSWRLGGLSILALLCLSCWTIVEAFAIRRDGFKKQRTVVHEGTYSSVIHPVLVALFLALFALYTLFNYLLVIIFTIRTNWSIWEITQLVKDDAGGTALSPSSSLTSVESWVFDVEELELETSPLAGDDGYDRSVIHGIIIPNYTEEIDTLRETLEVLASHPQSKGCYDICLAMEARETDSESKASTLVKEFATTFRSIGYTLHPANIPGEAAGKGSNVAWAARQFSSRYSLAERSNVVFTNMDSDSHLSHRYFAHITNMHLDYPATAATTMYTGPIIFDRNAHKVSGAVRVADIFWSASGISGLHKTSPISPPTSVYSLPLLLVDLVGGWDCGIEALGEDLHMYLKCFFALNGHLTSRTVPTPISQTNISGGNQGGIRGIWNDTAARYKQSLRHMWGALDTGFVLRRMLEMWKNRKQTSRGFYPLHIGHGPSAYFSENPPKEANPEEDSDGFPDIFEITIEKPRWGRVGCLIHRLFEAHYLPVHMTILVIAAEIYSRAVGSEDPYGLNWIFFIIASLRDLIVLGVPFYLFQYGRFHHLCVDIRERDMTKAGIAKGMFFSRRSWVNWFDFPVALLTAPLFGSFPCAHAEIMHLWTLDIVYAVSRKATRKREQPLLSENMV
ncbi:hypothetical protein PT974_09164 [Cladobotryum mycophilum]|uniref:Glycosyltransferase 2-like domain-containing protein n=1 Tax=Cladobotryum mycophilum TaxID=491253 RepID=A0ABR0SFY6_9HYPO